MPASPARHGCGNSIVERASAQEGRWRSKILCLACGYDSAFKTRLRHMPQNVDMTSISMAFCAVLPIFDSDKG
eukprot:6189378-Pleurochrysis_carterae.AAC.1